MFSAYMINATQSKIYLKVDEYNVKNEILDLNLKKDSISTKSTVEKIKLTKLEEQINREIEKLPKEYDAYILGLFCGIAMMGSGFYLWYFRTQSYNDLILKNESENLRNNKEVSIHKLQFEKEFLIYNELWKSLVELRIATVLLRPQGEVINKIKSEEERRKEKLNNIDLAFKACVNIYEDNKPFYPKDIYEEIKKVIKITNKEIIQFVRGKSYTDEYWENAEKNITEIINSIDVVCEKMRERIGLIKIEG
jgi:hypothetical protein